MATESSKTSPIKDSFVTGENSEGVAFRGHIVRLNRLAVVFEMYNPQAVLRFSEALAEFKIIVRDKELYSGKAVVRNLLNTGPAVVVCEATLNENSWSYLDVSTLNGSPHKWEKEYHDFCADWQKHYQIRQEFKLMVADMHTYFTNLRIWLDHVELGIRAMPAADRQDREIEIATQLGGPTAATFTALFERFEEAVREVPEELQAAHQNYVIRQLHPLLLCSPFLHRCFYKPLGYAGDYEMVNMILRNPYEGNSLYARVVNYWFIKQPPAEAHRNRIDYLTRKLMETTAQAARGGRVARTLSVGCGPAQEVQRFLAKYEISNLAQISLLDFNGETLEYTKSVIDEHKSKFSRTTDVRYIKKSVHHILKERGRVAEVPAETQYDFVYCAGLFDYLSNQVCQGMMNVMYEWVAPGGLLVATNVDPYNARCLTMNYVMDWHLIYRSGAELAALKSTKAAPEDCKIVADSTGVNVFLEVNKPAHV